MRTSYSQLPVDEQLKMLQERLYDAEREHFALEIGAIHGPGTDREGDLRRQGQLEQHMKDLQGAIKSLQERQGMDNGQQ